MLFGTIFGVIIVPGLYYIFGRLAEGKKLIRDESETPLSEDFVKSDSGKSLTRRVKEILIKLRRKDRNEK
jgi:HAE1 family hydrophobic/amphiphilic exporter-1